MRRRAAATPLTAVAGPLDDAAEALLHHGHREDAADHTAGTHWRWHHAYAVLKFLALLATIGMLIALVILVSQLHGDHCTLTSQSKQAIFDAVVNGTEEMCQCSADDAQDTVDATCECVSDAITQIELDSTELLQSYMGTNCITIDSLPYTVPYSHRCYLLAGNMTVSSAPGGFAIYALNKRHISIDFQQYELTFAIDNVRGIRVQNGSSVLLQNVRCNALTQLVGSTARCVQADTGSVGVEVHNLYSRYMRMHVFNSGSDMRVRGATLLSAPPGNGTTSALFAGVLSTDAINLVVEDAYIDMPYAAQATVNDGFAIGVYSLRSGTVSNLLSGPNTLEMRRVYARGTPAIDVHSGQTTIVEQVRLVADALGIFGSCAQLTGSSYPFDAVIARDVSCNVQGNNFGHAGILAWNMRALTMDAVSVYGAVQPLVGFYRGALISVGVSIFVGAPAGAQFYTSGVQLRNLALHAINNATVALEINNGLTRGNQSVTVDGATIHNGLVGVLYANNTENVLVRNVQVSRAVYGFVAQNYTNGDVFESNTAFRCCMGYFADATTSSVGFYGNKAVACDEAYSDLGTGNAMSVGTDARQNEELGTTGTGDCELSDPVFDPAIVPARRRRAVRDDGDAEPARQYTEAQLDTAQQLLDAGLIGASVTVEEAAAMIDYRLAVKFGLDTSEVEASSIVATEDEIEALASLSE
jgi:hypothetical protein